ncbi:MAG: hypothetical protein J2P48_08275 [Alphaproteobacteria bacterium]|nr:hypothetical protein [Alphaproteobacteria bacterium]
MLGTSVDQATWTTMPPGAANNLSPAISERIINRAINALNTSVANALVGTNAFADRFNGVIGDEAEADHDAFEAIGGNLIQAVAALVGGGAVPGAARYVHEQETAATEWSITHNLNERLVSVQVINEAGNPVIGDTDFTSPSAVTLTFANAIAGTAIIRR